MSNTPDNDRLAMALGKAMFNALSGSADCKCSAKCGNQISDEFTATWQMMDTAPKLPLNEDYEGPEILVYTTKGRIIITQWLARTPDAKNKSNGWWYLCNEGLDDSVLVSDIYKGQPLMWMPLPKAPRGTFYHA